MLKYFSQADKKSKAATEDEGYEEADKSEKDDEEPMEEGEADKLGHLVPSKSGSSSAAVDAEMSDVVVSNEHRQGWDGVRDVYKRAALTHCTRKAVIRMKWAQFEETIGSIDDARDILKKLVEKYPMLLEARMQQIDLERRHKQFDAAEKLYLKLMKQIPGRHEKFKNMKTWIAMKYARFQFKTCGNADKALAALRSALKKERGNPKLYSQIIDICYQRTPIDVTGVTASIELALVSKDLSNMSKLEFVQRRVELMQVITLDYIFNN